MANKILLIERNSEIADLVSGSLSRFPFFLASVSDGSEGLERAKSGSFDLVIIDVDVPTMNGLDVCRALRAEQPNQLIMFLSPSTEAADRILALELGADDYLALPFNTAELAARVRALLRRGLQAGAKPSHLQFKNLEISLSSRSVRCHGRDVKLTAIEFDVLYYLAANAGRVVSREELKEAIWDYRASGFDSTITSYLSKIRYKIEPNPQEPSYIRTFHGVGYQFIMHQDDVAA